MRVSRMISIYRAQRSQQGCSLSLGMLRLAEPPTGRARLRSSLKSPRNPITPIKTSRVATLHPGSYENLRKGARRVIGATAKPLYPIDGKAAGLDRRNPKTSLFEGGGPPQRWKEFVPRRGAHCAPVSYIAAPVTVITTMFREDARRVIGATAKPLYPIDGKAAGFDRRIPQNLPLRGRGTAAAVEGVRPRRYNNNPSKGRAKGLRGDRKALRLIRRQGRRL